MLLEDELGTINLIVPPAVYERHRLAVRTEPLVVAEGVLERFASGGGDVNVMVRRIGALEAPGRDVAHVREMAPADERDSEWRRRGEDGAGGRRGGRLPGGGSARHVVCPGKASLTQGALANYSAGHVRACPHCRR